MIEDHYKNREIDVMFQSINRKLNEIQQTQENLTSAVQYTNGKVRKMIVALVLVFGILLGYGFKDTLPVIASFL